MMGNILRLMTAVVLCVLASPSMARTTSQCICATLETPSARACVLAPGQEQNFFAQRALAVNERCTPTLCREMYKSQSAYTCDNIVVDRRHLEEVISCRPKRPTVLHLNLTRDFDWTPQKTPNAYQPIQLDINACSIGSIGLAVSGYISALKNKGCGCKNMVINVSSHGETVNGRHVTKCNQQTPLGTGAQVVELPSKDLAIEFSRVLREQGCEQPAMVFDSCMSGQIISDFGTAPVRVPILATTAATCVAPPVSNLWENHLAWCNRCDTDQDRKLTIKEARDCLNTTPFETGKTTTGHTMMTTRGPAAIGYEHGISPDYPVFYCATSGVPRRTGLQLRDWSDRAKSPRRNHFDP